MPDADPPMRLLQHSHLRAEQVKTCNEPDCPSLINTEVPQDFHQTMLFEWKMTYEGDPKFYAKNI